MPTLDICPDSLKSDPWPFVSYYITPQPGRLLFSSLISAWISKHILNSPIWGKEIKERGKEKREEEFEETEERKSQWIPIRCRDKTKKTSALDREIPETTTGNIQLALYKKFRASRDIIGHRGKQFHGSLPIFLQTYSGAWKYTSLLLISPGPRRTTLVILQLPCRSLASSRQGPCKTNVEKYGLQNVWAVFWSNHVIQHTSPWGKLGRSGMSIYIITWPNTEFAT